MRILLGLVALNGLALLLGLAVLYAAGLVRARPASLVAAGGAATLCGLALIGLGALFAVVAGLGMGVAWLALAVAIATVLLAFAGFRRDTREPRPPWRRPPVGIWLPAAIVLAFIGLEVVASRHVPIAWDAAHNWSVKAVALSFNGKLEGALFTDAGAFSTAHLDYPLLHPVIGALTFRFTGETRQGLLIAELWILVGATVLAVPWLVDAGRRTWLAVLPMLLVMVTGPMVGVLRGDADVPMACFLAAGAVATARAIETSRVGYAVLAAIWLGAAANVKNEGLAFAAGVIVIALAVVLVGRSRGRLLLMLLTAAGVAVLAAPWRLWVSAHGPFPSDIAPLSDALHAGYLRDHLPQLDAGAQALLQTFSDASTFWLVPALLAVTGMAIASGQARSIAALHLGAFLMAVLAVVWVYWISQQPDVAAHIQRTSIRTVTGPLFLAAAGLAHLLPRLIGELRIDELAPPAAAPEEDRPLEEPAVG